MSLTPRNWIAVVEEIDRYYRLRPEEAADAQRKITLSDELREAFKGQGVGENDVKKLVLQYRRPLDESEDERIRVATRPGGWDLRRLHDQNQRAAMESKPAQGCEECGDRGRRTIIAVVQRLALLRVEPLVVACDCGQGDGIKVGDSYALRRFKDWERAAGAGEARFQNATVVLAVDAPPVFGPLVIEHLDGLNLGLGSVIEASDVSALNARIRREYEIS